MTTHLGGYVRFHRLEVAKGSQLTDFTVSTRTEEFVCNWILHSSLRHSSIEHFWYGWELQQLILDSRYHGASPLESTRLVAQHIKLDVLGHVELVKSFLIFALSNVDAGNVLKGLGAC